MGKCSRFLDKVREDRYIRVKTRQVRKFNNFFSKGKGTILSNNDNNREGQSIRENGSSNNRDSNNRQVQVNNSNNKSQLQANITEKWVINLSSTSLTEGQQSVLTKGPNFSLTPKYIPNIDYITAVESMCGKLKEQEAMELRADINVLLRKAKVPKPNITRQESIALSQLRRNKDRVILTVDKGVVMVLMDREDYINRAKDLLVQPAYRAIPADPTNRIKAQLMTKLRRIKRVPTWMRVCTKLCISLVVSPQSSMDYPKSIKQAICLGP